jgi:putative DNA primase/helicase
VRRAVGYSLTADCREECLFLLRGAGFNGKTVLLNILRALNGDYAANTPFSTFEASRYHTIPNDLAALVGKRLVTASETAEARRLNEARIKALTGRDPITCRFMRQEWFTYTPVFKVWLAMNNKPVIRGTDEGIWRRIRLIPFTVSFKGRADLTLEHKLKRELPGILAWGVRGCLDCQRNGLQEPDAVLAATEAYRTESDVLGRFLADCTIAGDGLMVRTGTLYQAYIDWCKETGEKPLGGRWFGRKLSERGVDRFRDKKARYYVGLGLPADESNG